MSFASCGRFSRLARQVTLVLALAPLVLALGCGEKEPAAQAQELLNQGKTEEAVQILTKLHEQNPKAYEPILMLGQAAEAQEDWEAMAKWYEAALELPEGKRSEKLLKAELHAALVAQARKKSGFPDQYEALLKRAAAFEEEMRLAETPANEGLFNLYRVGFDSDRKAGRFDAALQRIEQIGKLYYDRDKIREYTKQKKELEKEQFFAKVRSAFEDNQKAALVKTGRFDTPNNAIALSYTFTVPEPTDTEQGRLFDPTSPDFLKQVQYAACWGGLRDEYAKVLNEWAKASPVGRELTDDHVNAFLNRALQGQEPKWEGDAFDPAVHKESAAGLKVSCAGNLPVDFVVENFRKVKLAYDKEAKEGGAAGDKAGEAGGAAGEKAGEKAGEAGGEAGAAKAQAGQGAEGAPAGDQPAAPEESE